MCKNKQFNYSYFIILCLKKFNKKYDLKIYRYVK